MEDNSLRFWSLYESAYHLFEQSGAIALISFKSHLDVPMACYQDPDFATALNTR